jgi:hypothetical protein
MYENKGKLFTAYTFGYFVLCTDCFLAILFFVQTTVLGYFVLCTDYFLAILFFVQILFGYYVLCTLFENCVEI